MSRKLIWVLAAIMAAVSSFLVYMAVDGNSKNAKANRIPTANVMVALVPIPPRTVIQADWVELRALPVNAIPPDAVRMPKDAIGKITRSDILPGEPVRKDRLLAEGERLGLPFMIPEGYRAMSVAVDEASGVAGFVKPGDMVDVLLTVDDSIFDQRITTTLLQSVQVLAVAQDMEGPVDEQQAKKGKVVTSVTLAVDPMQAEKLTLAQESGKIRLALRPLNSADQSTVDPINPLVLVSGKVPAFPSKRGSTNSVASNDNGNSGKENKPVKQNPPTKPTTSPPPTQNTNPAPVEKPKKKVEVIMGEKSVEVNVE